MHSPAYFLLFYLPHHKLRPIHTNRKILKHCPFTLNNKFSVSINDGFEFTVGEQPPEGFGIIPADPTRRPIRLIEDPALVALVSCIATLAEQDWNGYLLSRGIFKCRYTRGFINIQIQDQGFRMRNKHAIWALRAALQSWRDSGYQELFFNIVSVPGEEIIGRGSIDVVLPIAENNHDENPETDTIQIERRQTNQTTASARDFFIFPHPPFDPLCSFPDFYQHLIVNVLMPFAEMDSGAIFTTGSHYIPALDTSFASIGFYSHLTTVEYAISAVAILAEKVVYTVPSEEQLSPFKAMYFKNGFAIVKFGFYRGHDPPPWMYGGNSVAVG